MNFEEYELEEQLLLIDANKMAGRCCLQRVMAGIRLPKVSDIGRLVSAGMMEQNGTYSLTHLRVNYIVESQMWDVHGKPIRTHRVIMEIQDGEGETLMLKGSSRPVEDESEARFHTVSEWVATDWGNWGMRNVPPKENYFFNCKDYRNPAGFIDKESEELLKFLSPTFLTSIKEAFTVFKIAAQRDTKQRIANTRMQAMKDQIGEGDIRPEVKND